MRPDLDLLDGEEAWFVGGFVCRQLATWLATKTSRSHLPTGWGSFFFLFNWLVIVLVKAWGSTIQGMNDTCAPLSTEGASSHKKGTVSGVLGNHGAHCLENFQFINDFISMMEFWMLVIL